MSREYRKEPNAQKKTGKWKRLVFGEKQPRFREQQICCVEIR
jgi:hypothetical protein